MTEEKYYVGLKSLNDDDIITDFLWEDHRLYPCFEKPAYALTKSELAKIQDGALYKQTWALPFEWLSNSTSLKEGLGWEYNEAIDKFEYTNTLIKLIPVENN